MTKKTPTTPPTVRQTKLDEADHRKIKVLAAQEGMSLREFAEEAFDELVEVERPQHLESGAPINKLYNPNPQNGEVISVRLDKKRAKRLSEVTEEDDVGQSAVLFTALINKMIKGQK